MSQLDKIKEQIGYLKVIFSILIAIDISLIVWLYQQFEAISLIELVLVLLLTILVSCGILYVNKKILSKIDEIEDL